MHNLPTYRVMEPPAGRVPGTNDAMMLPAPRATSSRFGLMLWPYFAAFCLAETMLSRNPATAIILVIVSVSSLKDRQEQKVVHSGGSRASQEVQRPVVNREADQILASIDRDRAQDLNAVIVPAEFIGKHYGYRMSSDRRYSWRELVRVETTTTTKTSGSRYIQVYRFKPVLTMRNTTSTPREVKLISVVTLCICSGAYSTRNHAFSIEFCGFTICCRVVSPNIGMSCSLYIRETDSDDRKIANEIRPVSY